MTFKNSDPYRKPTISTEYIPQIVRDEPCLMENMVMSQKAPFMKTLRYIFLTE